ncbi:MAG: efflux RND transporter periplasmic adaptor subunit [Oleiphilaceae bacterium]|nr:efflux RND transporter periplasmic adaptor subunit [Oleiphilaceae bacterium]
MGEQSAVAPVSAEAYVGRVEAGQRVEVGFDLSGKVTAILKREGETFMQGEDLARLDTDRLEARKSELSAQVARAKASLRLAESSLARALGLKKSGNISDQALDEAYQRRDAAVAEHRVVLAQLNTIDVELQKSVLTAPFDGVVIDRISDVGRTAVVGLPILLLEQTGEPEIKVNVPLAKAERLQTGQPVRIFHRDGHFDAPITRVNLSITNRRVSEVYIKPDSGDLIPGELVQVELGQLQSEQGIWVPTTALTEFGRGLWSVYLAQPNANGQAVIEKAVVQIRRVRGDLALIGSGLTEAQIPHIVREATHRIVEGQHVQLEPASQLSQAH